VFILLNEANALLKLFPAFQSCLAKGNIAPTVFLLHEDNKNAWFYMCRLRLDWWLSKILWFRTVVKRNFWPLWNSWTIVCQLFCFIEVRN